MRVSRMSVRGLWAAALLVSVLTVTGSPVQAGSGGAATPFVPSPLTVGQTGIPASITLENRNNGAEASLTNTVCNAGDASPPCGTLVHNVLGPELGILYTPSCNQVASGECTLAGADPGVFAVSATATGNAGTACAGTTFTTSLVDTGTGAVRFAPLPLGSRVSLPGFGSSCVIDFTLDVLKMPASDLSPGSPGFQTAQTVSFTSVTGPFQAGSLSNFARGSAAALTIELATPSILTTSSSGVVVGGAISDTATVAGRVSPGASTVTFRLYGPDDLTCALAVFTSTVSYPIAGGSVSSPPFTPTATGIYRWIATYDGDTNNRAVSGSCGDASEQVVVSPPTTTTAPATTVSPATTSVVQVASTLPEPETTLLPTTTTGTIPVPDLESSSDTLPVTGRRTNQEMSWALATILAGVMMVAVASVRRRPKARTRA